MAMKQNKKKRVFVVYDKFLAYGRNLAFVFVVAMFCGLILVTLTPFAYSPSAFRFWFCITIGGIFLVANPSVHVMGVFFARKLLALFSNRTA